MSGIVGILTLPPKWAEQTDQNDNSLLINCQADQSRCLIKLSSQSFFLLSSKAISSFQLF